MRMPSRRVRRLPGRILSHGPAVALVTASFVVGGCAEVPDETAALPEGCVSEFGRYEGCSEARFDEWVTTSRYVDMRDGVRLAVDVTRPAVDGVAVEEPLPVVWTHSRYHRNPSALVQAFNPDAEDLPEIRSRVDAENAEEAYAMPPTVRIYRTDEHPSGIELPVVAG